MTCDRFFFHLYTGLSKYKHFRAYVRFSYVCASFSLFLSFFSVSPSICLSVYLSIYLSVLGHFGHGHFGHGRFGQDISATDISANGHFGHGHFGHGKNTYFLLLQMELNRLLPFKINMFDHYKLRQ